MDFNLRRGLFISFAVPGGVAIVGAIVGAMTGALLYTLYTGIILLVIAAIWGFLFLCPKSPVKKCWWAISDKLIFMVPQELGYEPTVTMEIISVYVDLTPKSGIMVDRIAIKIGRKRFYSFEWKAHKVVAHEKKFLDFIRPDWLGVGKHKASLIAYTPEGFSKSEKFILEVRNAKTKTN